MERTYEKKNVMLHFKASQREEQTLAAMSILEGRNWSEMMRQLLREGAERRGLAVFGDREKGGANVTQP